MNDKSAKAQRVSLIRQAGLAPSSHNTQPWRFRISPTAIDLYADPARALPVNDPQDRERVISCGCALMNLRVAAAEKGLEGRIELLPDPDQPQWLARLALTGRAEAPGEEAALAPFIALRRTCRQRFLPRMVEASVLERLIDAAQREGAWLRPLTSGTQRERAAALVAEGDTRQWADPQWRRELAAWMHSRGRGEGLAVPALAAPIARFVVRTFNMGARLGAKDRLLAETAPLLAVLGTDGDQRRDWLRAGQALERVLLAACGHGLQASYLNQPVQVASLRRELQGLTGDGFPQVLLRLGYPGHMPPVAPRRDAAEVIIEAGEIE